MSYSAEIWAEDTVSTEYLEAAAEAILRLSDGMGFGEDPDISLTTISDDTFPTNRQGQVDRTVINKLQPDGPLRLLVTAKDLGVGDRETARLNFVFGTSQLGSLIMSAQRLKSTDDFAALTLHEAGHAEGLVQPTQANYNRASGFGGHCVNQCVMLPGNSYDDMRLMIRRYKTPYPFCGDCSGFLLGRPRLPE